LYDAKLDQSPAVAISGQVPSKVLGRGAFQDVDLSAVFRDVAVSTTTIHSGSDHAELAALAVKHALDGRGVGISYCRRGAGTALGRGRRATRRAAVRSADTS